MEKLSVVLLSWKRPKNIPIILNKLYAVKRVDEIVLWNNNPEITFSYKNPKLQVINSPINYGPIIRYCLTGILKNNNIMFQDDDLYHTKEQIEKLFLAYVKDTSRIYGPLGRNLENFKYIKKNSWGNVDIVIGRTTLFHKRHLYKFFKYLGSWNGVFEDDDILFSFALKRKHRVVDIGGINELPNINALSKRPGRINERQEMVDYCLKRIPGLRKVIVLND
ncbi:hypothetical protein A2955_01230 [Candidatus Woesebacteria bacterium RIFCSPLOWO2_01_FULL_37_19]|uniref:Glycosyl transferase 64 domain-containing protein n=1 Tax=Candidatus Woesebacteria bacterium RIFCSPLOWO2_01_FULL_37_19 TaxID=1802514 RepID=A0A1F8B669_9BACT|nr:MAG: hypothetical protein A2955_01230 [Candidatus Woesebacteria bacterium RIFCSPLOWO2_01_FULL_37_19]